MCVKYLMHHKIDIKHLAYYVAQSTCSNNVIGCYNYCNSHVLGIYFRDAFLKNMGHKGLWSTNMVAWAQIYNLGQVIKGLGVIQYLSKWCFRAAVFNTFHLMAHIMLITKFLWHNKNYMFAYLKKIGITSCCHNSIYNL